jgi:hypothetical protein
MALQESNPQEQACLCVRITAAPFMKAILKCGEIVVDKNAPFEKHPRGLLRGGV